MISILIFIHILLLFSVVRMWSLFRRTGWNPLFWLFLLCLKTAVGYALISWYDLKYGGSDMRSYLTGADAIYRFCLENPMEGMRVFLGLPLSGPTTALLHEQVPFWFGRPYSEWLNDSRTVIKIQSLIRFVSSGDVWIHLLWTNLAALAGGVALFRFFITT
jgi:hypothetical protein